LTLAPLPALPLLKMLPPLAGLPLEANPEVPELEALPVLPSPYLLSSSATVGSVVFVEEFSP